MTELSTKVLRRVSADSYFSQKPFHSRVPRTNNRSSPNGPLDTRSLSSTYVVFPDVGTSAQEVTTCMMQRQNMVRIFKITENNCAIRNY